MTISTNLGINNCVALSTHILSTNNGQNGVSVRYMYNELQVQPPRQGQLSYKGQDSHPQWARYQRFDCSAQKFHKAGGKVEGSLKKGPMLYIVV